MKRKTLFLLSSLSLPIAFLPILISCKRPDYEKPLNPSNETPQEEKKYDIKNAQTKSILDIYENEVKKLFIDVKANYRKYRLAWGNLKRQLDILRTKMNSLANEQTIKENEQALKTFITEWLSSKSSDLKSHKYALYLFKYSLIFQDVDAVLYDVNLVFETKEFIQHLQIVDDRLSGKDINLGTLQRSLEALWVFLNSHVMNPNKITKKEDLENINIESDKNSHNHSHAIVNLTYELGLWHEEMIKYYKQEFSLFKTAFENTSKKVLDNINHVVWKNNFSALEKTYDELKKVNPGYDLLNPNYQTKGKKLLNKIKSILEKIRDDNGIPKDILPFK
ncbi:HxHSH motif-containing lipoprotein [Metamycoplasma buccale]|uniref:HxHSH motif-containing lipoprotein n=1 Tax=Metamycoplasma buccale TaxID=55602 RepID=UPI00398F02CE